MRTKNPITTLSGCARNYSRPLARMHHNDDESFPRDIRSPFGRSDTVAAAPTRSARQGADFTSVLGRNLRVSHCSRLRKKLVHSRTPFPPPGVHSKRPCILHEPSPAISIDYRSPASCFRLLDHQDHTNTWLPTGIRTGARPFDPTTIGSGRRGAKHQDLCRYCGAWGSRERPSGAERRAWHRGGKCSLGSASSGGRRDPDHRRLLAAGRRCRSVYPAVLDHPQARCLAARRLKSRPMQPQDGVHDPGGTDPEGGSEDRHERKTRDQTGGPFHLSRSAGKGEVTPHNSSQTLFFRFKRVEPLECNDADTGIRAWVEVVSGFAAWKSS